MAHLLIYRDYETHFTQDRAQYYNMRLLPHSSALSAVRSSRVSRRVDTRTLLFRRLRLPYLPLGLDGRVDHRRLRRCAFSRFLTSMSVDLRRMLSRFRSLIARGRCVGRRGAPAVGYVGRVCARVAPTGGAGRGRLGCRGQQGGREGHCRVPARTARYGGRPARLRCGGADSSAFT